MKIFRLLFTLAALSNFAFGIGTAAANPLPSPLFYFGLMVGFYGLAYAYVAAKPENGDVLVFIGLMGKVLVPLAWLLGVYQNEISPRTFSLVLFGDFLWWYPFLFYLLRKSENRRKIVISLAWAIHVIACFGLLLVAGGTEMQAEMAQRFHWVQQAVPLWTAVWFSWIPASMSFLALTIVWSQTLLPDSRHRYGIGVAIAVAAFGVSCDVAGEWLNISWMTDPARTLEEFGHGARAYLLLSAMTANGLYCLVGLFFSYLWWKANLLRGGVAVLGVLMWCSGLGLTVTAALDYRIGIVLSGVVTMTLFLPWLGWMGWKFRNLPTTR